MKLTGECLEAFNEWKLNKGIENFYPKDYSLNIAKSIHNAIIIDFFDSVGIYIDCGYYENDKFCSGIENNKIRFVSTGTAHNTRTEASNAAIEKANFLYNNKKYFVSLP